MLIGGCVELGADGPPFAPLTAALRGLVQELGAGVRELLPAVVAPELARLLPGLGAGATGSAGDVDGARARLFEEVLTLLGNLGPAVLVVEDAHWADRSSRDLLDFLVRSQRAAPRLLLVVTYRTDDLHRGHPLRPMLAQLERLRWVERLELRRLSRPDVAVLLRGLTEREPEPALIDAIHGRSEGNPLFVESPVTCGADREGGLPESLRDLLLAPVRRLAPETQEALLVAATGGIRVPHALLSVVSGLDDTAARGASGRRAARSARRGDAGDQLGVRGAGRVRRMEAGGHIATVRAVQGDRYEVIEQNYLDFSPTIEPHWTTFDLRSAAWPDPAVVGFVVGPLPI